MTQINFARCLPKVLAHEGGYVNHPKDPGGATNKGVTQATYNAWRRAKGLAVQSVRAITLAEVAEIYKANYWDAVRADELPAGPDYATFDGGVNSGPSRGIKWLQKALGVAQDGRLGPATLASANDNRDRAGVVRRMCRARLSFVQSLRTWSTFGKGWARRIAGVEAFGVRLALEAAGNPPEAIRQDAKNEEKAATASAQKNAGGATAAGGGAAASGSQVDPARLDPSQAEPVVNFLLVGGVLVAVFLVAVFLVRAHVQRARAKAYAASAAEV